MSMDAGKGEFYNQVNTIVKKGEEFLSLLASMGFSPNQNKVLDRLFTGKEAEKMVGKTIKTIAKLYADDADNKDFFMPAKSPSTGRSTGFSLKQINAMRDQFGTRPSRREGEKPFVLAVQSFKGGVAKSVTTVHLAQYLALAGYRTLIMDCDPQASATSSFGYIPDLTFGQEHTMLPYLNRDNEDQTLDYAIIKTYFDGIDLIPGCLPLYEAEFGLYYDQFSEPDADIAQSYKEEFANGIATVSDKYDIVILDSPPALGMISINIMVAADGIIVPTPPSLYDFASTTQYFKMAQKISQTLPDKHFSFMKILATRFDAARPTAREFVEIMREEFGKYMYNNEFKATGAIPTAAMYFKTLYDISPKDRAEHGLRVDKKNLGMLDNIFAEILEDIHQSWGRTETKAKK